MQTNTTTPSRTNRYPAACDNCATRVPAGAGMTKHPFSVDQIVRPANDGEDQLGRRLHWTRIKGRVTETWTEGGFDAWEQRTTPLTHKVRVHWFYYAPYPRVLESDWIVAVND